MSPCARRGSGSSGSSGSAKTSAAIGCGYCEGGFIERTIGAAQLPPAKPAARPEPLLGRFNA